MALQQLKSLEHYLRHLINKHLWAKVMFALLLGVGAGVLLSPNVGIVPENISTPLGSWLALPGKLFLKLVQMIMIPLIFASIISGIVSNTGEQLKQMGLLTVIYFIITTVFSIALGVAIALFFKPGSYIFNKGAFELPESSQSLQNNTNIATNIPDAISNLLPENPLASMVTGEMLSIVIFTIIIGIAVSQLSDTARQPIMKLLAAILEICMTIVRWAMLIVPIAVFGLIAQLIASIGVDSLTGIGFYAGVVLLGLLVLLVFYMVLLTVLGGRNPFTFLATITEVQLLAFSTTSSAAVMPLSMKTAEEKLNVSPKVSNFLIPIGSTINMDGTALYQCVSTLFIAQAYGIDMTLSSILLVMFTIVGASIGTPAIPGGGVVVLATVLQSVGIPGEGIVIIIGVERILGMFRTVLNVTGDLTACVIFNRWMQKE